MMKNQSTNKSASDSTLLEFFKIFIPDSGSLHMVIPPAFVKYLNGTFPKTATIKDHMGKSWRVTVRKMDDLVFFKNGWKDFVDYHSLEYGDLLTFQYDGQCTFDVKIYFKNGCKKVAEAAHSVPIVEAVVAEARNSVPILKVKEEPVGEEEYVKPSISNKRKRSEVGSKNVRKRRSIAARNRGRPRNASNSEEHVGPTRPFFERTMKRWSNKTIYIPGRLVKDLNISLKPHLVLRDEKGNLWPITICFTSQNRISVSSGWCKFYEGYKLRVNDRCEFEFVLERGNVCGQLNVKIIRSR